MAPVAKKKKKPVKKSLAKHPPDEREAKLKLEEYTEAMAERAVWARKIFQAQDARTQEAIGSLIDVLSDMADNSREARITVSGGGIVTLPVDREVFENGWLWIAVRLMSAAHEWDIQVANFHPIRKRKNA